MLDGCDLTGVERFVGVAKTLGENTDEAAPGYRSGVGAMSGPRFEHVYAGAAGMRSTAHPEHRDGPRYGPDGNPGRGMDIAHTRRVQRCTHRYQHHGRQPSPQS